MKKYTINKGVGEKVEFKGLKAQYFLYFFVVIVCLLFLYIILSICNVSLLYTIGVELILGGSSLTYIFKFNEKYGEHGLMKIMVRKYTPRFLSSKKIFFKIIKNIYK